MKLLSTKSSNNRTLDELTLRNKQQIPDGDWTHWIISAGRGFGKTLAGSCGVNKLVLTGQYQRIGLN